MLSHHLGVGIKKCSPCGGEFVGSHGNRIFKLGRERDRAASSAQPFPRRSARLRPHPSKPCAVPERLLSPRNLWQIPFGTRTRFKTHVRHLGAHLMVSNKWVVIVGAHLGVVEMGFTSPRGKIPSVTSVLTWSPSAHFGVELNGVSPSLPILRLTTGFRSIGKRDPSRRMHG